MSFTSDKPLAGGEFDQFLKLKEHVGTYRDDVPIEMKPVPGERRAISASLPLPSIMPSGDYTVRLYCFEDGRVVDEASAGLTIVKTGLSHLENELAHEHSAAYGIMAILVAMAAGITTGVAFSSRGGQGH